MWMILFSLAVGIIVGVLKILPPNLVKINLRFQQIGVVILIFSMGASVGSNRELIKNIQAMGLKSLVFALLTSILSIIVLYFISRKFLGDSKIK